MLRTNIFFLILKKKIYIMASNIFNIKMVILEHPYPFNVFYQETSNETISFSSYSVLIIVPFNCNFNKLFHAKGRV